MKMVKVKRLLVLKFFWGQGERVRPSKDIVQQVLVKKMVANP